MFVTVLLGLILIALMLICVMLGNLGAELREIKEHAVMVRTHLDYSNRALEQLVDPAVGMQSDVETILSWVRDVHQEVKEKELDKNIVQMFDSMWKDLMDISASNKDQERLLEDIARKLDRDSY